MIARFAKDQSGAAFIEFGIMLPMLLLLFGVAVEGTRTFWSYQTTLTGVREAARYLSRAVDANICATGGSTTAWDPTLGAIVRESLSGEALIPSGVSVGQVSSTLTCTASGFRGGLVGVATVTASLSISLPFSGLFTQSGENKAGLSTSISDSARVLGR